MRPSELLVAALSPVSYTMDHLGRPLRVHPPKLYAGVIAVGVMAISADLLFRFIERRVSVPGPGQASRSAAGALQPDRAKGG